MKLRNKKTGEIANWVSFEKGGGEIFMHVMDTNNRYIYSSLAELNEEWEDVPEEPKEYWFIDEFGMVQQETDYDYKDNEEAVHNKRKAIGNYFETKEEAEKAVEKLKAWKRLKDNGFWPIEWSWEQREDGSCSIIARLETGFDAGICDKELDLLFGGEK